MISALGMLVPNKSLLRTFDPLPCLLSQERAAPQMPLHSDVRPRTRRVLVPRIMSRNLIATLMGFLAVTTSFAADPLSSAVAVLERETGEESRAFSTRDFGRDNFKGPHSVLVPDDRAETLLWKIRTQTPPGIVAFIGTQHSLAKPPVEGTELVVAVTRNQFDILRIAASDAVNYGRDTEDLVRTVQSWDERYGIDIYAARTDTIQLRLKSLPQDMKAFANEVYEFCPDIVDQGDGDVENLAAEIAATKAVYLWWD